MLDNDRCPEPKKSYNPLEKSGSSRQEKGDLTNRRRPGGGSARIHIIQLKSGGNFGAEISCDAPNLIEPYHITEKYRAFSAGVPRTTVRSPFVLAKRTPVPARVHSRECTHAPETVCEYPEQFHHFDKVNERTILKELGKMTL